MKKTKKLEKKHVKKFSKKKNITQYKTEIEIESKIILTILNNRIRNVESNILEINRVGKIRIRWYFRKLEDSIIY